MKQFSFRLENILEIRRQQEKVEQKKFAKEQANYQKEVDFLKVLFERRKETYENLIKLEKQKFDKRIRMIHVDFVEKTNVDIDLQRINVEKAEVKLKKQRSLLLEAMKKRKILEKLREKKKEDYNLEMKNEEQKILDEVAARNFIR